MYETDINKKNQGYQLPTKIQRGIISIFVVLLAGIIVVIPILKTDDIIMALIAVSLMIISLAFIFSSVSNFYNRIKILLRELK